VGAIIHGVLALSLLNSDVNRALTHLVVVVVVVLLVEEMEVDVDNQPAKTTAAAKRRSL
jgi:hypothetical protein